MDSQDNVPGNPAGHRLGAKSIASIAGPSSPMRYREKAWASVLSVLFLDNSGAEERAVEDAAKKLEAMLAKEVDPVPCPKCHLYQTSMVHHLRDGSYWWMNAFALIGVLASIISGAVLLFMTQDTSVAESTKLGCGIVFITTGLGALGLWTLRRRMARAYEPNSDNCVAMRHSCKQPTMLKEAIRN